MSDSPTGFLVAVIAIVAAMGLALYWATQLNLSTAWFGTIFVFGVIATCVVAWVMSK
jgi:hypothetical protein